MKHNRIWLVIIVLIFIFSVGVVCASHGVADNQTAVEDEFPLNGDVLGKNVTPSGNTFDDVQMAIDNAEENDVIEVEGVYSGENFISVNKSVTIHGKPGTVFKQPNYSPVFNVYPNCSVTLRGLHFTSPEDSTDSPSAIYSEGNLAIVNCTFKGFAYSSYKPVIESSASLKIADSNFKDNEFAIKNSGNCIVENSLLQNNLMAFNAYSSLSIFNSVFDNSPILSGKYNINARKSVFKNVRRDDWTDAIHTAGDLVLTDCDFTNNGKYSYAVYVLGRLTCTGCNFKGNSHDSYYDGCIIYIESKDAVFKKTNFIKNTAFNGGEAVICSKGKVSVYNCYFKDNGRYDTEKMFYPHTIKASKIYVSGSTFKNVKCTYSYV